MLWHKNLLICSKLNYLRCGAKWGLNSPNHPWVRRPLMMSFLFTYVKQYEKTDNINTIYIYVNTHCTTLREMTDTTAYNQFCFDRISSNVSIFFRYIKHFDDAGKKSSKPWVVSAKFMWVLHSVRLCVDNVSNMFRTNVCLYHVTVFSCTTALQSWSFLLMCKRTKLQGVN